MEYAEVLSLFDSSTMPFLLLPIFLSPRAVMRQEVFVYPIVSLAANPGRGTSLLGHMGVYGARISGMTIFQNMSGISRPTPRI